MPKTIHTPRDELVCGKLDVLEDRLRELGLADLLYLTGDIRHDCQRMEAKLISRRDEASPEPLSAAQGVPEGWKLVPIEPTEEMITAFELKLKSCLSRCDGKNCLPAACKAFLSAAPEQADRALNQRQAVKPLSAAQGVPEDVALDVERYRWLKESNNQKHQTFAMTLAHKYYGFEWDKLIDAAMITAPEQAESKEGT